MSYPEYDYETGPSDSPCPDCVESPQPPQISQVILSALRDPLFLVVCILTSVSCLCSLSGSGLPLLDILTTVFLWLTYAKSRENIADANHLRCVSGVLYAKYIINYILASLVLFLGLILAVSYNVFSSLLFDYMSSFTDVLAESGLGTSILTVLASLSGMLLLWICIVGCALLVLGNIFIVRYLHGFTKSVHLSLSSGTLALKHVSAAKIVLFIIGGFSALDCLGSLADGLQYSFISSGASAGAAIISGLLIQKYLSQENI